MSYKIVRFLTALASLLILASCVASKGASTAGQFAFDGGRLIVKSTAEELSEASAVLERVDVEHIPDSMSGGILFEGELAKRLPDDQFGQSVWLMKPKRFILGGDKISADGMMLISPKINDGGVMLSAGVKYRIFTVNLEGRFYIWRAVVIQLDK